MPKKKSAVFLKIYIEDGKQVYNSHKEVSKQEGEKPSTSLLLNEEAPFQRAANRKAKRYLAKLNGTRLCDINSKKGRIA